MSKRQAQCPNPNCSVKTLQVVPELEAQALEEDALAEGEGDIKSSCLVGQSGDKLVGKCMLALTGD